jgi:hypothetical protein
MNASDRDGELNRLAARSDYLFGRLHEIRLKKARLEGQEEEANRQLADVRQLIEKIARKPDRN